MREIVKKKEKKASREVRTSKKHLTKKITISGEDLILQIQAFERKFQKRIGRLIDD